MKSAVGLQQVLYNSFLKNMRLGINSGVILQTVNNKETKQTHKRLNGDVNQ